MHRAILLGLVVVLDAACAPAPAPGTGSPVVARVRPGITVLLEDSIHVIRGRRIGLLTNQTGIDEHGVSDIDLLRGDAARAASVDLRVLFSPEHGIRGTEDREGIASGIDAHSGLPIISLYGRITVAPSDSALAGLDALVFDLQDVGTRTWTYVGAMLYSMQAAARNHIPFIVLDRPNPINGIAVSGPMLDTALANPYSHTAERPGRPYALHPIPLRHGLTMGELARYYRAELEIPAELHVIPASGWRRAMWFDETGLPWVRPSPNLPDLTSATVYPALVALEATNVSVGRGTPDAFQRFGAPWLPASRVVQLLESEGLGGIRFVVDSFTPHAPTDSKYGDRRIAGVKVQVTARDSVDAGLVAASVVWALRLAAPDSFRVDTSSFDLRFGSAAARRALLAGEAPRDVMLRGENAVADFRRRTAPILLY